MQYDLFVYWQARCTEFALDVRFRRISIFDACLSGNASHNARRPSATDCFELLSKPAIRRKLKAVFCGVSHHSIISQVRTVGI
ncbi:hypothetical protein NKH77_25030 [Streptomyces sp. M19]